MKKENEKHKKIKKLRNEQKMIKMNIQSKKKQKNGRKKK